MEKPKKIIIEYEIDQKSLDDIEISQLIEIVRQRITVEYSMLSPRTNEKDGVFEGEIKLKNIKII